MESLFTSIDLYDYVMGKLSQPIPTSLKLSLLFKSIQKDFPVDNYMVVIFLNYTRCLINMQSDDIPVIFKTSKLKYFKYWCFWREYMGFLITSDGLVDKVVEDGIKFLNVKEFTDKDKILIYLTQIKNATDRRKFVYIWKNDWMTIEDISKGIENINTGYKSIIEDEILESPILNAREKENIKIDDIKINFFNDNEIKVQFTDLSYSPALKRNNRHFPNTPITDDVNKFSFKEEVIEKANGYKCKIEDITLGEDTNLYKLGCNKENISQQVNDIKPTDKLISNNVLVKEQNTNKEDIKKTREGDLFYLNNKKLLKINIIGKGGSSKVYKVFYENEFYALKIINIEMDSTLKDLLLEEIDLLKKLQNIEGIIKMIDYEVLTDNIYILLEYGESVLSTFMKIDRVDPHIHFNRVRFIWQEILLIVSNIHDKRIIHGDLKPANFVFVKNKLKIIDFGISKSLNSNTTRLDLDMVCGTLNYCAPELFFENKKRRSSDVWSLGIILYELWYGKTPLDSYKTYLEKKENIVNIKKNLKIVSKIDVVISMCLNEDCRKRPTVKELLKDSFICNTIN